jgi:hypothetical protein
MEALVVREGTFWIANLNTASDRWGRQDGRAVCLHENITVYIVTDLWFQQESTFVAYSPIWRLLNSLNSRSSQEIILITEYNNI